MRCSTCWLLQLLLSITTIVAASGNWTKPNSLLASFADTYIVGERIYVSWLPLNDSINDLWLTRFDPSVDGYAFRLLLTRNLSLPGNYEWTIGIDTNVVLKDTRFILQFLPAGSAYNATQIPQLPSPPFNVILLNQTSTPNGTVGAPSVTPSAPVPSSTSSNSGSSQTPAASGPNPSTSALSGDGGSPINRNVAVGVAIGAGLLVLGTVVGAYLVIRMYRRPKPPPSEVTNEEFKISGPYEVLGSNRQPTELSSKETMIHELNSSKETMVSELDTPTPDSPTVCEKETIKEKAGLHELPG